MRNMSSFEGLKAICTIFSFGASVSISALSEIIRIFMLSAPYFLVCDI